MNSYAHIVAAVTGRPWAIRADVLAVIVDMLAFRVQGGRLTQDEIASRIEAAGPRNRQTAPEGRGQGIALLALHGIIAPRAAMLEETSTGGTGLDTFMGQFRQAMADPEVGSIVVSIDSPGGQAVGVMEAAAEIRAARAEKPVIGVANNMAASAAFWIGSAMSELVCSPSGEVGSIGVYGAHQDLSGAYEKAGVKTTLISAGKFKVEGNPYEPLTEEARAYAQGQVDDIYAMFLDAVAQGRGVSVADVRANYGEGRMLLAKPAKKVGMIDRIDTLDGVIRRELSRPSKPRQSIAAAHPPHVEAMMRDALEASEALVTMDWDASALPAAPEGGSDVPAATEPARMPLALELDLRRRRAATR